MRIFVGNLNWATTRDDLYAMFSQFGPVERIELQKNSSTGQPCGFAFVHMAVAGAQKAIGQLHGIKVRGRNMNVRQALPEVLGARKAPAAPARLRG
jgi:RNA recognition motif-containing protein